MLTIDCTADVHMRYLSGAFRLADKPTELMMNLTNMPAQQFNSYAELFLTYPHLMERIKAIFGEAVYSDDNFICDPAREELSAIASVCLYGNELHVLPFDEATADFIIELEV